MVKFSMFSVIILAAGCVDETRSSTKNETRMNDRVSPTKDSKNTDLDPRVKPQKKVDAPKLERFVGVKHLPKDHPCHDEAVVLDAVETSGVNGRSVHYVPSTVGQIRERTKKRSRMEFPWIAPRRVEGVKWTLDGDHMIITCEISGKMSWQTSTKEAMSLIENRVKSPKPFRKQRDFYISRIPDVSGTHAHAFIGVWSKSETGWAEKHRNIVNHWDDSENAPWAYAKLRLVGTPTLSGEHVDYSFVSVYPCEKRLPECTPYGEQDRVFHVQMTASKTSGESESQHVIMNCDGKREGPKSVSLPNREQILGKARGLIREACKAGVFGD